MADQMQGAILDPGHPAITPNLDRLAARGMRFSRAHTVNPICSPARASLMTGLLPHAHGMLTISHAFEPDQFGLRADLPHWAQSLRQAGFRTGYFGKWHVNQPETPKEFGWDAVCLPGDPEWKARAQSLPPAKRVREGRVRGPEGYKPALLFEVMDRPAEACHAGIARSLAEEFIAGTTEEADRPWCCFVGFREPHDPFSCAAETFARYEAMDLPFPPNADDPLEDRPGLYRRARRVFEELDESARRAAMACYYGSITELDAQIGSLLDAVERTGQADDTLVIFSSDHGECLGAHGLFQKNAGAFEEIYRIPLLVAGPGVAKGAVSPARASLMDLSPTLLELSGLPPQPECHGRSLALLLAGHTESHDAWRGGFAEYFGTRHLLSQRVLWDGNWKLVWNGFDEDELYDLDADPYELRNLAPDPRHRGTLHRMMSLIWKRLRETGDTTLLEAGYASLRTAAVGPGYSDPGFPFL